MGDVLFSDAAVAAGGRGLPGGEGRGGAIKLAQHGGEEEFREQRGLPLGWEPEDPPGLPLHLRVPKATSCAQVRASGAWACRAAAPGSLHPHTGQKLPRPCPQEQACLPQQQAAPRVTVPAAGSGWARWTWLPLPVFGAAAQSLVNGEAKCGCVCDGVGFEVE